MSAGYKNTQAELKSTHDGFPVFWQKWEPDSSQRKRTLVVQHGFGEHSDRYENLLQALLGTHTAVYALDARGHGRTGGKRGHVDQFQNYVDDLADLVRIAREETWEEKVFLLGHSLGGVIALQYATQGTNQDNLHALITSSPGLIPVLDFSKSVKKAIGTVLARVAPTVTVNANLDLKYISRDESVVQAYREDKMVHGMISLQMGSNLFKLDKAIFAKAHTLRIPTYIFHGSEDGIVNVKGSQILFEKLGAEDKTLKIYEGLYHETMNELPAERQKVLADLRSWILAH